jgi:hypothetical protein
MATFADFLDTVATDNDFQTRLNQAKEAYQKQYGKEMPITSGTRTRAEQERLFRERQKNPNLVAQPGTSLHETGEAADIPTTVPESFLNQFGIHRPLGSKDPVHAVLMPQKAEAPKAEGQTKSFGDWIQDLPVEGKVQVEKKEGMPTSVGNLVSKYLTAPAASLLDVTLGGVIPGVAGPVTYAGARALGKTPEEATALEQKVVGATEKPFGKALGVTETPAYQTEASRQIMDFIGQNLNKGAQWIAEKTGLPVADVQNMMQTAAVGAAPVVGKVAGVAGKAVETVAQPLREIVPSKPKSGMVSAGAAAVPDEATVAQALQVVSPALKQEIQNIPVNKINLPTLQRHIESDTLPVPVRLTEGQATGDVVKLSKEQNRRGQDPALAQRFNEQNGQLVENLEAFRERSAPDAPGSRTIDHGQGLIDAYKELDTRLTGDINQKYQALRDAAGGQFPVDAPKLLNNIEGVLKKNLLSNDAPPSQFKELQRLATDNNMTFEDFLSLRRNLGQVARTATDGNMRQAASLMIKEIEKLPLQEGAQQLKPLADVARNAARDRFQMLEKDPAYRAVVDDKIPAEKFIEKFVVNGVNKNVQSMVNHLGADSVAHQHMRAGTINYLRDRAGIVDGQGNFSQAGYNKALKFLDDSNKMPLIFDGETSTGLKTLGNVARYTQAQPRGAFVNNSNTLVGALAERAGAAVGKTVETGLNVAVPGLQLGTTVMEMRARRAAAKETQKALKPGAGIENE